MERTVNRESCRTVAVEDFRNGDPKDLFGLVDDGPLFVADDGSLDAVVLSIPAYKSLLERIESLESGR
ncbi:type II toxin-antitoxin system Phd/YefM family antitoxin [Bifidobacterium callitrichidarum]|uniref:type II toxin-antitoxin system Phd/YefM family antitoxin n=1 Tax=Bifidobacterium callitrichidarum TaxID=2052941 RepID=UPI0011B206A1|nr:type II toxin-antitoxin system Phd/YefM family antitoxin [Bifidobacterium callitrichidarum]